MAAIRISVESMETLKDLFNSQPKISLGSIEYNFRDLNLNFLIYATFEFSSLLADVKIIIR